MIGPLTYLDAALLAVAFISALLSMYRGLTRELLSIVSWIVAAGAVLYFVLTQKKFAEEMAQQMGAQVPVAQIAIGAVIFLIVLVVVHLITARISDSILDSRVGMIDRIFGFLFGLARGFILIVVPYMFYESFIPDQAAHPVWVREAKSLPYLKSASEALRNLLVQYVPSSLTSPATGEQQGFNDRITIHKQVALSRGNYHITVTRLPVRV